jgi:hypothetical protein
VKRLSKRDRAVHLIGQVVLRELVLLREARWTEPGMAMHDHISRVITPDEFLTIAEGVGYTFVASDTWPPEESPPPVPRL